MDLKTVLSGFFLTSWETDREQVRNQEGLSSCRNEYQVAQKIYRHEANAADFMAYVSLPSVIISSPDYASHSELCIKWL